MPRSTDTARPKYNASGGLFCFRYAGRPWQNPHHCSAQHGGAVWGHAGRSTRRYWQSAYPRFRAPTATCAAARESTASRCAPTRLALDRRFWGCPPSPAHRRCGTPAGPSHQPRCRRSGHTRPSPLAAPAMPDRPRCPLLHRCSGPPRLRECQAARPVQTRPPAVLTIHPVMCWSRRATRQ